MHVAIHETEGSRPLVLLPQATIAKYFEGHLSITLGCDPAEVARTIVEHAPWKS